MRPSDVVRDLSTPLCFGRDDNCSVCFCGLVFGWLRVVVATPGVSVLGKRIDTGDEKDCNKCYSDTEQGAHKIALSKRLIFQLFKACNTFCS